MNTTELDEKNIEEISRISFKDLNFVGKIAYLIGYYGYYIVGKFTRSKKMKKDDLIIFKIMMFICGIMLILLIASMVGQFYVNNTLKRIEQEWIPIMYMNGEETGSYIQTSQIYSACQLWPADEPLILDGEWTFSTDYDQWVHCY